MTQPEIIAIREFHRAWGPPTPLHALPGGLFVKDESRRFGLNAFKILGASWALHKLGVKSGVIATATSGNHGRAVAHAAARLGLTCIVYLPSSANSVRAARIAGEGAEIVRVDGNYEDAVRRCVADSKEHGWHLVQDLSSPDYREIAGWIIDGYSTLFGEAEEQVSCEPQHLFLHMGAGNLAEAGLRHFRGRARITVARPAAGSRTMDCLMVDQPSEGLLKHGVDEFLAITDAEVRHAVDFLATHGVPVAPSGAAGVAAWLKTGRPANALAIVSEAPVVD